MLLEAKKISIKLEGRPVLHEVDLALRDRELVGLAGPNGAGKSTLLRILAGSLKADSGSVLFRGSTKRAEAREIAYLPQQREIHWPILVRRLVALGRIPHLMPWRAPGERDEKAISQAMRETDTLGLADRRIDHLAGGEKGLVFLARALATEPSILLADEPVQGLDPAHGIQVMELLKQFSERSGGAIVVMHDLTLAARFCHRLVLLHEGKVLASGQPAEVLSPKNLRQSYHIEARYGDSDAFYVVPWERIRRT
ncbi:MAG: ABC transporter ATP-binding protein [Candidatus Omnitrophota bacterium]